jgi:diguanylate cyclase (GGDEF)-like protein
MQTPHIRTAHRGPSSSLFHILVLEQDEDFARLLKFRIENSLAVEVHVANSVTAARTLLENSPGRYFLSITSVLNLDSDAFEKIDLLGVFNIPAIVVVDRYEDDLRDQLIKRQVIDYVVKDHGVDIDYISDLIVRIHKNLTIKVLVVDDSKVSQFVIARELLLQKFQVLQVSNGIDALSMLKAHRDIKLVLVDHQMSVIDGITFVQKAREIYPRDQLLIIGLSTSLEPRLAVKYLKAGANDFISKPFSYEILLCRINQNLHMLDAVDYAKHLSNTDYLSNVYNRRYFFEQGNRVFNSLPKDSALTVMMFDIDYFKKVNDHYGHEAGDEVIRHFASALKEYFNTDIVARLGGEEFAVISLSEEYLTSFERIEQFRQAIANQRVPINNVKVQYTCSIGATNILGNSLNDMLVHADRLLYVAKQNGRNRLEGRPSGLD